MLEKSITFIANCDFCSEYFDTDETEFMSAVEKMKQEGWKVFKTGGEWQHKCGACQAESAGKDFEDLG